MQLESFRQDLEVRMRRGLGVWRREEVNVNWGRSPCRPQKEIGAF
jgi:hypothetical protein